MNQQIDGYKNVLWELTWKLELFTHIVPVPMAIYFSGVTGNLVGIKEIMMTIFTGGLAGTLMVLMGIAWRTYILKKLFRSYDGFLEKGGTEKKILMKLKTKIINHPFHEGRMIVFRWCFGVPLTHILFILFYKVKPEAHQSIPFLLLYIVPVSYISYILISERVLQKILTNDSFKNLPPLKNKALSMNYFRRLLISFLSVAIMPFCVLGYLMYAMDKGFLKVSHPFLHIGIIGVSMFVPIMVVSYVMAGSLRSGIDKVTHTLKRVSLGDFSERLAVASNDEFGMQAKTLNDIILKLSQMYTEIKDLNQNLERKVEQRTAELKESLEHVKKLKFQQDGDYFLTSLLLKPLGKNEIKSDKVKIDFLIKQKKEFEFKNRVFEIGGDLCLSHSIKLKGKPYIIFINADAMGKSIQGAGGAIVLGAVFKSILERNKIQDEGENIYPERWLKNVFIELHRVFESFEGSMLVSLVFGLIDESSGLIYFINAEHPWMVLYRDAHASFIENELTFRKLGTSIEEGFIYIRTFLMQPGDIMFAGSDGRDDLNLSKSVFTEVRNINEDENLFLSLVERAGGDIQKLYKEIQNKGQITDDLSILRISYTLDAEETCNQSEEEISKEILHMMESAGFEELSEYIEAQHESEVKCAELYKCLSEAYSKFKKYKNALRAALLYAEKKPYSIQPLDMVVSCAEACKNYSLAIEFADRIRLRQPMNLDNLFLLSSLYFKNKNEKKAKGIVEEILFYEPQNPKALRYANRLHIKI